MKATHPLAKDRNRLELAGCLDGHRAFTGPEHVVIDLTNPNSNCPDPCNMPGVTHYFQLWLADPGGNRGRFRQQQFRRGGVGGHGSEYRRLGIRTR